MEWKQKTGLIETMVMIMIVGATLLYLVSNSETVKFMLFAVTLIYSVMYFKNWLVSKGE